MAKRKRLHEKLVRKESLKAKSQPRETLLDKGKRSGNDYRVTFNITYYPVFKNIRIVSDEQHRKVFTDIPRIGFKSGKILKDDLVRSVLPKIDVAGNSGPCCEKRPPCESCKLMKKLLFLKSKILTKPTTYTKHLIAIPKTQYIL